MYKRIILRELEKNLNDNWISNEGYYVNIVYNYFNQMVTLSIHDKKTEEVIIDLEVMYIDDINDLISEFIDKLMTDYIIGMNSNEREKCFYGEILEMFLNAKEYLISNVA